MKSDWFDIIVPVGWIVMTLALKGMTVKIVR